MKTLEMELPDALAERLEELVEEGWFTSEAEVARLALADYLRRRRFELQERFLCDDNAWALGPVETGDLEKRLQKDRPMTTVSLRMPEDVVQDLERIAPRLGFSGYLPLLRAYVGQGLRRDLAPSEGTEDPAEHPGRPAPPGSALWTVSFFRHWYDLRPEPRARRRGMPSFDATWTRRSAWPSLPQRSVPHASSSTRASNGSVCQSDSARPPWRRPGTR